MRNREDKQKSNKNLKNAKNLKSFKVILILLIMKILIVIIIIMIFADDDKYRKIGSIRTSFREFVSDYYKPIRTDDGFAGKKIVTLNIRVKEIDMKINHLKNILM